MTTQTSPSITYFSGLDYNSQFYQQSAGISQTFADQRYLQRTGEDPLSIATQTSFSGLVNLSGGLQVTGGATVDSGSVSGVLALNGSVLAAGVTVTPTQISYLSGATSNLQTQINALPTLASTNAWTGTNSFNVSLPTSTLTPLSSTQLVTKAYVDTKISGNSNIASNNNWTGNNAFWQNVSIDCSPITNYSLSTFGNTYQTGGDSIVNTNGGVANNLVVAGNIIAQAANFGGPLVAQNVTTNSITTNALYVGYSNFQVGPQIIGYTYNAGYLHISNVYNFTLIKSIPTMTAAFANSYQPAGINLSILYGVNGTGYILLQPLYSVAFIGTDGSVLCYIDNTFATDQIFVLVSFPGTVTCSQLNIFYQYIQI